MTERSATASVTSSLMAIIDGKVTPRTAISPATKTAEVQKRREKQAELFGRRGPSAPNSARSNSGARPPLGPTPIEADEHPEEDSKKKAAAEKMKADLGFAEADDILASLDDL